MRINDRASEPQVRTEVAKGARPATEAGAAEKPAAVSAVPPVRTDRVQISDAGRALAAQASGDAAAPAELTPERTAEIRQRVLQGAYNSLDVVDSVARRLLETGEV